MNDDGLTHNHHWAMSRPDQDMARTANGPVVTDASAVPTPSSVRHDDVHYAS